MKTEDLEQIACAIRSLSMGGIEGPRGLEAICMALAGEGMPGHDSIADAIRAVAESIQAVATALEDIGDAITVKNV